MERTAVGFSTTALWMAEEDGGLGLPVRGALVTHGVVEVADMCEPDGRGRVAWMEAAAARELGRLGDGKTAEAEWVAVHVAIGLRGWARGQATLGARNTRRRARHWGRARTKANPIGFEGARTR